MEFRSVKRVGRPIKDRSAQKNWRQCLCNLVLHRKRQTNTGSSPPDFDAFTYLAAQALGVSSATRLRGKSAKPGSTEAR